MRLYIDIVLKEWRYTLPIVLAIAVGTTLIFYIPPLIIASFLGKTTISLQELWPFVVLFAAAWMSGELLWRFAMFLMIQFEAKVIRQLYEQALKLIIDKELSFFANRFTGTITKNLLAYTRRFEAFFDTMMFEVVAELFPAAFAAVVLFFISPWLSFGLVAMMSFGAIIVVPLIRRRVTLVKQREDAHAEMAGHVSDVITNIAAIKSFGAEPTERGIHEKLVGNFIKKAKRSWHYQNVPIDMIISPIYVATNALGLAIVLSLGVGPGAKAALFISYSYFVTITRFLWSFNKVYRRLEESITDASLFVAYTMDMPKVIDTPHASRLEVQTGMIDFRAVSFTHAEDRDSLFENFSLTIPAGQKVGLVGHSGAGKSTIVSLLLRFMDIDGGSIQIDGQDISHATQQSLHTAISFVPQDPLLFHRSLRENIAYGKSNATDEEVQAAARQAHALEFIEKLPQGFDTLVGERGVKLSGGQRQRVAIARAILKAAPILVLDEATSALDSESEKLIQQSLTDLMKDRTSIVIAHRLSTIAKLDRIIVLENGEIVEDGTHAELLKKNGIYAKLWTHQSGGFIED